MLGAHFFSESPGLGLIPYTPLEYAFGLGLAFLAQLLKENADETTQRHGEVDKPTWRKNKTRGQTRPPLCGVKPTSCAAALGLFALLPLVSGEAAGPTSEVEEEGHSPDSSRSSAPSFTIFVVTILIAVNVSSLLIGRARQSLGLEFLPYTLLVYSFGIALGFLETLLEAEAPEGGGDDADAFSSKHWEDRTTPVLSLFRALSAARTVDPDIVMLVLLPPLIYTAASHANWHTFKKSFGAIATLAFPCVGFSTCAIAYLFKLLPHTASWSFTQALTLGAILAATDPVAVVAALHELGAPPKLDMLIDGESLVNDGSAMVFFLIFNDLGFEGVDISVGEGILRFARLALGGPLLGAAMFCALWFWLDYHVSSSGEAMVSVMTCYYATFYIAEKLLRVSGVLAVVVLGLGMARKGKWAVPPAAAKGLELLNENFASLAENFIFFLAGVVTYKAMERLFEHIDHNTATRDDDGYNHDELEDEDEGDAWAPGGAGVKKRDEVLEATPGELVVNLLLVYLIVHLVRFMALVLSSPVLMRTGYRFSWRELAISWFGGLRGAVGLALALEVVNEGRKHKQEHGGGDVGTVVREELLLYVAGVVVLTLVLNGTLIGYFYHYVQPYPESAHETELRRVGILKTAESVEHTCSKPEWVASHAEGLGWGLGQSDFPTVLKLVPTPVDVKMKASGEFTLLDAEGKPLRVDVLSVVLHDVICDKARQAKATVKKCAHAILASHRLDPHLLLASAAATASKSLSPQTSRACHGNGGNGGSGADDDAGDEGADDDDDSVTVAVAASAAGVAGFDAEQMLNAAWGKVLALARVRPAKVDAIFTPDGRGKGLGAGGKKGELGVALADVGKGFESLGVMLRREELEVWFAGCDENGDGMMSLNEFHAAAEQRRERAVQIATEGSREKRRQSLSEWESVVASIRDYDGDEHGGEEGGDDGHCGGGGGGYERKLQHRQHEPVVTETHPRAPSAAQRLFPVDNSSAAAGAGAGAGPRGAARTKGGKRVSSGSSFLAAVSSPWGGHGPDGEKNKSPKKEKRQTSLLDVSANEQEQAIEELRETTRRASMGEQNRETEEMGFFGSGDDGSADNGDGNEKGAVTIDMQQHYRQTLATLREHSLSKKPAPGSGNDPAGERTVFRGGGPRARSSAQGILSQLKAHKAHSDHYVLIHDRGSVGRIFSMINELYEGLYQHKQLVESAMCSLVDATTAGEEYIEGELKKLHSMRTLTSPAESSGAEDAESPGGVAGWARGGYQSQESGERVVARQDSGSVRSFTGDHHHHHHRGGGGGGGGFSLSRWLTSSSAAEKERKQKQQQDFPQPCAAEFPQSSSSEYDEDGDDGDEVRVRDDEEHGTLGRAAVSPAFLSPASFESPSPPGLKNQEERHEAARELTIGGAIEEELDVLLAGLPAPRTNAKRWVYMAVPVLRPLIRFLAFRDIYHSVMVLTAFIKAHRDLPRTLAHKGLLRAKALQRVKDSCASVNRRAFERLRTLAMEFPVAVHVTRVVLFALDLNHAKNLEVLKLHEQGFLDHHQVANFIEPFHRTMHALHFCVDSFAMHRLVLSYDAEILATHASHLANAPSARKAKARAASPPSSKKSESEKWPTSLSPPQPPEQAPPPLPKTKAVNSTVQAQLSPLVGSSGGCGDGGFFFNLSSGGGGGGEEKEGTGHGPNRLAALAQNPSSTSSTTTEADNTAAIALMESISENGPSGKFEAWLGDNDEDDWITEGLMGDQELKTEKDENGSSTPSSFSSSSVQDDTAPISLEVAAGVGGISGDGRLLGRGSGRGRGGGGRGGRVAGRGEGSGRGGRGKAAEGAGRGGKAAEGRGGGRGGRGGGEGGRGGRGGRYSLSIDRPSDTNGVGV